MLIYILHSSNYYTFRLPKIPSGNYVLEDHDANGGIKNLVSVYAKDSQWVMSSNENVRIVQDNQFLSCANLELFKWYTFVCSSFL